jgi:phosphoenolpyruvate-protein phosphotransferase (PTS system enzyme I)
MKPPPSPERVFRGRPAAPGLAIGPLVRLLQRSAAHAVSAESADVERRKLEQAVAQAQAELRALVAGNDAMGADILEFQLELLGDPSLTEPAAAAIAEGASAIAGWQAAIAEQAAVYESGDDEYFRARAADLADLRERVAMILSGEAAALQGFPAGAILLSADLTPSRFLSLDWRRIGGAALTAGSPASHVAMLARARGVPLVTGLDGDPEEGTDEAVLDADAGLLVTSPVASTRSSYAGRLAAAAKIDQQARQAMDKPAVTAGGERIEVMINVDDPAAVPEGVIAACDGVGLMRTEFLFLGRNRAPTEDEQFAAYVSLLDRLKGKPAIIRTLDIGGDKPLPHLGIAAEANPFLGLRGIRLCLARPELFRPQIRALLRATPGHALQVMLPMVATSDEIAQARTLFGDALAELTREGKPAAMPSLGIMVETPAAALAIDLLDADFYSIGSNDLTQYVMAAARDAGGPVAKLNDPRHPAVIRLIEQVVRQAQASGKPVSLCGDMASDPALLPILLQAGLRKISVAPAALGRVKLALGSLGGKIGGADG